MVTPIRLIALLVSLAIALAGPASSWAASGDCCCTEAAAQIEVEAVDSCCQSDAPAEQDTNDNAPGECPSDCDSCVTCSVMGQPVQFNRPATSLDLPDPQPDAFTGLEPESHAIEPHFSLLRPPQS